MKGDFTRSTFRREKHYSAVRMQQGRLQLDADWNEQADIQSHLMQTQLSDVIGVSGVLISPEEPDKDENFKIGVTDKGDDLTIAAGRIYVDGILCELEKSITYFSQPDYPKLPDLKVPASGTLDNYIVYLDVWQRHVTTLEDPDLLEPALQGIDTATRTQTIAQVKLAEKLPEKRDPFPSIKKATLVSNSSLSNDLYRIEIHEGGSIGQATFKWSRDNGTIVRPIEIDNNQLSKIDKNKHAITIRRHEQDDWQIGQWIEVIDDQRELRGETGTIVQLQDVILKGGDRVDLIFDPSTKKTSTKNKVDQEITPENFPYILENRANYPKVRRWDSNPKIPGDQAIRPIPSNELAAIIKDINGIEIQITFNNNKSTYRTGDYWLLPVRATEPSPSWSTNEQTQTQPKPLPALGIEHHYCRLATVTYDGKSLTEEKDLRSQFISLIELKKKVDNPNFEEGFTIGQEKNSISFNIESSTVVEGSINSFQGSNKSKIIVTDDLKNVKIGDTIEAEFNGSSQKRVIAEIEKDPNDLIWMVTLKDVFTIFDFIPAEGIQYKITQQTGVSFEGNKPFLLNVQGNIKTENLELTSPTSTLKAGTFEGKILKLVDPDNNTDAGTIEAKQEGNNRQIAFNANNDFTFTFNQAVKLPDGVSIKKFSEDILSDNTDVVPTEKTVKLYVDGNIEQVNQAIELKASKAEVATQFEQVNQTIELKASKAEVATQFEQVNQTIELKASKAEVATQFEQVNQAIELKASKVEVATQFEQVNQVIELKASKAEVATQFEQVNQAIELKASKAELAGQIAEINTALQGKATQNGLSTVPFSTSDLSVTGDLTLSNNVSINTISQSTLGDDNKAIPTETAVKAYFSGQMRILRDMLRSGRLELNIGNLIATGNLIANGSGGSQPTRNLSRLYIQGSPASSGTGTIQGSDIQSTDTLQVGDTILIGSEPRLISQTTGTIFTASSPLPQPLISPLSFQYQQPIARFVDDRGAEKLTLTATGTTIIGSFTIDGNTPPIDPKFKLYVNGSAYCQEIDTQNLRQRSSRTLKENIQAISPPEVMQLLAQLNPVQFTYRSDANQQLNFGFIAEEVPDVVASDDKTSIKPIDIVAIVTKAVQEQQKNVESLMRLVNQQQQEIATLKEKIQTLEESSPRRSWFG